MTHLLVRGGRRLHGEIAALGAKNAALPMMAAAILCQGDVEVRNVPDIADVRVMADLLRSLGVRVEVTAPHTLRLNSDGVHTTRASYDLVRRLNASFDVAGPLLGRFGEAEVALPGGCNLGQRRVNLHLEAFRALGAEVHRLHGFVQAHATGLVGTRILFPHVSVGATKNALMAACLAKGVTVIENAAREPEIEDLVEFLQARGARIRGGGTARIEIEGVAALHGGTHDIIADRIETGTFLAMAATSGGDVLVRGGRADHLEAVLAQFTRAGQSVTVDASGVRLTSRRPIRALDVTTAPHPGFPTDLHPPLVAMLVLADGISVVRETIFDGRFMYVGELVRLGANIRISDHVAIVTGVKFLAGAPVEAPDIRAGAALIGAALAAEGESLVTGIDLVERGYERIDERLTMLGADIVRVEGTD